MAFETTDTKLNSLNRASALLNEIRTVYSAAKAVQSKLTLYNANTDPIFNAAINATLTSAERTELSQMLTQVNALLADWESNHKAPLGLP